MAEYLMDSSGAPVVGFEIASTDCVFFSAIAPIDGETVVVTSPVPRLRYLRYDWSGVVPLSLSL